MRHPLYHSIYLYPAATQSSQNKFIQLQAESLSKHCKSIKTIREAIFSDWLAKRSSKMAVLNWYEDRLAYSRFNNKLLEFFRSVILLLLISARVKHIVLVRHNFWPHDLNQRDAWLQKIYTKILDRLSTTRVVMRPIEGAPISTVVPHPLYSPTVNVHDSNVRDIPYLCFGMIRSYKNIDKLLECWPPRAPLVIAGECRNESLRQKIKQIVASRKLDVTWYDHFLDDVDLENLILRTRHVVMTHADASMIVSGTFYHAASLGTNILITQGEFGRYASLKYSFVHLIEVGAGNVDLEEVNYIPPKQVLSEIQTTNGSLAVDEAWRRVIADLAAS